MQIFHRKSSYERNKTRNNENRRAMFYVFFVFLAGRDSNDNPMDYSLLVACFAGGVTAVCILIVGIVVTLYRRNRPILPTKTQTHIVHFAAGGEAYSNLGLTTGNHHQQSTETSTNYHQQIQRHHAQQHRVVLTS